MTFYDVLAIGIGGFIGTIIRYLISAKLNSSGRIPIGTLIVNLIGAFLIGYVLGIELTKFWTLFLITGFAGTLTTFSTLNKELIELWRGDKNKKAVLYFLMTFSFGIFLTLLGYYLGSK